MATVRDIMHPNAMCIASHDTAANAARLMAEHDIGALPICDPQGRVMGMVTDRDLAIVVMAAGFNAETYEIGDLPQSQTLVVAEADEDADLALAKMSEHQIRRLPVVEDGRVAGILTQADVARSLPDPVVAELVYAVSIPDLTRPRVANGGKAVGPAQAFRGRPRRAGGIIALRE